MYVTLSKYTSILYNGNEVYTSLSVCLFLLIYLDKYKTNDKRKLSFRYLKFGSNRFVSGAKKDTFLALK